MKTSPTKGVLIDWGKNNPKDWRNVPDEEEIFDDEIDNDEEDIPCPQNVLDILGFDPDVEFKTKKKTKKTTTNQYTFDPGTAKKKPPSDKKSSKGFKTIPPLSNQSH